MGRPRKVTEFTEPQVAFPLDDKEQHAKARELAELCDEIDRQRASASADASGARKSIRALEKRRRLLAECVRTGTEKRNAQEKLFREPKPQKPNEHLAVVDTSKPVAPAMDAADAFGEPAPRGLEPELDKDAFLAGAPTQEVAAVPPADAVDDRSPLGGTDLEVPPGTRGKRGQRVKNFGDPDVPELPATTREPRAGGEPTASAADFADPWEEPLPDVTPPATSRAKREKNKKPNGSPEAA